MPKGADNRVEGLLAIENASVALSIKKRAASALSSVMAFYDSSEEEWCSSVDFVFIARILMRLADSGSVRRALEGDYESDRWFEEEDTVEDCDSEGSGDESFGKRRHEANLRIERFPDPGIRELATETIGTALLLQMFEKVLPEKVQDFVFLAAAAAHVFSSPDVVSHWSIGHAE